MKAVLRHRQYRPGIVMAIAAAVFAFAAPPALADRIDGEWCDGSRHFVINGPSIVTPGGNNITGSYGRHDFSYTIPSSEPGAGGKVEMRLINDENANVTYGSEPPKVWRRCKVTS